MTHRWWVRRLVTATARIAWPLSVAILTVIDTAQRATDRRAGR